MKGIANKSDGTGVLRRDENSGGTSAWAVMKTGSSSVSNRTAMTMWKKKIS